MMESTQTLGDGTRIHNEHQVTIYRDSQGRVRRETPDEVSIMDPNRGGVHPGYEGPNRLEDHGVRLGEFRTLRRKGVFAFRTLKGGGVGAAVLPDVVRSVDDMPMVLQPANRRTDGPNTASVTINSQTIA